MLSTLILTIIGADRPGLVQLVADAIAARGGNWLESRLCRLGGEFAGIVRAQIAATSVADLATDLSALGKQGLHVVVHVEDAPAREIPLGVAARLELVGNDRPGIVKQVTSVLANHHVNVEEFSSECVDAPMGGHKLFQARVSLRIPHDTALAALRLELERIASDLMVDLHLRED